MASPSSESAHGMTAMTGATEVGLAGLAALPSPCTRANAVLPAGYRDGDSLSRVKTRDERDARPLPDASGMGMGKTPAVGEAVQVAAA